MAEIGVYGKLIHKGSGVYQEDVARWFVQQKLDWCWLQPPFPYTSPAGPCATILKNAGRRIIIRLHFWDAPGVYPTSQTWTELYNNNAYDAAVVQMVAQINNFGIGNIYAVTISEEEPAQGYGWNQAALNVAHYVYGWNVLYDKLKTACPSLRIFSNNHPLTWLTDDQVKTVKQDGFFCHVYAETTESVTAYLARGMSLAQQMGIGNELYTLIYAATGATYEPPGDPSTIRPNFEAAMNLGYKNIGFYCSNYLVSGQEEPILFNDYPANTGVQPWIDPHLHKQAMMSLINQYGEVGSSGGISPLAWGVGGLVLIGLLSRKKR